MQASERKPLKNHPPAGPLYFLCAQLRLKNPPIPSSSRPRVIEKPLASEFFAFLDQAVKIFVPQRRTNVLRRDQPNATELMTGIIRPLEGLEKVLRYEPSTGRFFWLIDRPYKTRAGDEAGHLNKRGYLEIRYNYKTLNAHRIAWYLQTGEDPQGMTIDHINGNRADNRFENLRIASHKENSRNRKKSDNKTSKYKGVYWYKRHQKWKATIGYEGRAIHLGYFHDEYEAHLAYCKAALELQGEFANFG